MSNCDQNDDYTGIKNLIGREIAGAVDSYNERALKNDLLKMIESEEQSLPGRTFTIRKPVFALVSVLLFITFSIFISRIFLGDRKINSDLSQLRNVFSSIPSLNKGLENRNKSDKISDNKGFVNNLSWTIKRGLYSSYMKDYSKADIKDILENSLSYNFKKREVLKSSKSQKGVKGLDFEVRLRNLIKNKKLNQFFSSDPKNQEGV